MFDKWYVQSRKLIELPLIFRLLLNAVISIYNASLHQKSFQLYHFLRLNLILIECTYGL